MLHQAGCERLADRSRRVVMREESVHLVDEHGGGRLLENYVVVTPTEDRVAQVHTKGMGHRVCGKVPLEVRVSRFLIQIVEELRHLEFVDGDRRVLQRVLELPVLLGCVGRGSADYDQ